MFLTAKQFYVFIACLGFGGFCGLILSAIRYPFFKEEKRLALFITDVISCTALTGAYLYFSFALNFPSLRLYMPCGVVLGIIAYMKSFHIILAKPTEKLYNKIKEKIKRKIGEKNENDGRKIKKGNGSDDGRRRSFGDSSSVRSGLSVNIDKSRKRQTRRTRRRNSGIQALDRRRHRRT